MSSRARNYSSRIAKPSCVRARVRARVSSPRRFRSRVSRRRVVMGYVRGSDMKPIACFGVYLSCLVKTAYAWLRAVGILIPRKETPMQSDDRTWTLDEQTAMSRAFDRGNYANAYGGTSFLDYHNLDEMSAHERTAFVLGFFSTYSLDEIGSDREIFDECYFSAGGRHAIEAGYCADRGAEYTEESETM